MNKLLSLILVASVAGCGASELTNTETITKELRLSCWMTKTVFTVGEKLPPPNVSIHNKTDQDVNLIGPTITVIACTLVQPDGTTVPMCLAMPTGFDPRRMPPRKLKAQTKADFTPGGIWYYKDGVGYDPYFFSQEGVYEFRCEYEELRSNTIELFVREKAFEPVAQPASITLAIFSRGG